MNFIGVDLHKKSITVCVMDEKRKVLARKTLACTQTDEILEFFRQFRPFKVVVEAGPPHQNRRTGTNGESGIWRESELLRHIIASFHDVCGRFSYHQ